MAETSEHKNDQHEAERKKNHLRHETLMITPDSLLLDNRSLSAVRRLQSWYDAKNSDSLVAYGACSDARASIAYVTPGFPKITIRTIAGQFDPRYRHIINHKSIHFGILATHFDGSNWHEGHRPEGCGGIDARHKQLQDSNFTTTDPRLDQYIQGITEADGFKQALQNAQSAATQAEKDIIATILDHTTGRLYPIARYDKRGALQALAFESKRRREPINTSSYIYTLDDRELVDPMIVRFFHHNEEEVRHRRKYDFPPDPDDLKIQNPHAITITDSSIPPSTRLPKHFFEPNTVFQIRLPVHKVEGKRTIQQDSVDSVVGQLAYPILHSVDDHDHGFKGTGTLIIETHSIHESNELAIYIAQQQIMDRWISRGGQIITTETVRGKMQAAETLSL